MCEQTEVNYLDGDIVWVKLGPCWWPGEVCDVSKLPIEIVKAFKKQPIAVVKFFQEDQYEYVKNLNHIYKYNCRKKNEFIKKGLDMHRAKNAFMDKFPADVCHAESLTGGDPDIITSDLFVPEQKPSYSAIFGTPTQKKTPKSGGRGRHSVGTSKTPRPSSLSPLKRITHPRFVGKSDHEVRILEQTTPTAASSHYTCHICGFESSRLNVIVLHNRSHSNGTYVSPAKPKTKKHTVPKKGKKLKSFATTSSIDEDLELIRQGVTLTVGDSTDTESDKEPHAKSAKRKNNKGANNASKKAKVSSICNNLLADWGDSDSNEESATTTADKPTASEPTEPKEDARTDTSATTMNKSVHNELLADWDDKNSDDEPGGTPAPPEKQVVDAVSSAADEKASCFDFDEEVEHAAATATVLQKSPGRKIPRVIPQKRVSQDTEDSMEADQAKLDADKSETEESKDDGNSTEEESSVSQDNSEDKSRKDTEPDVEAFKSILDETAVPELPTIQEISKSREKSFDECSILEKTNGVLKTSDIELPSTSDTNESTSEKLSETHITAPKKRIVRNFEEFENLLNEQSKTEDESSSAGESSVEVSKLKSQLMSKLTESPTKPPVTITDVDSESETNEAEDEEEERDDIVEESKKKITLRSDSEDSDIDDEERKTDTPQNKVEENDEAVEKKDAVDEESEIAEEKEIINDVSTESAESTVDTTAVEASEDKIEESVIEEEREELVNESMETSTIETALNTTSEPPDDNGSSTLEASSSETLEATTSVETIEDTILEEIPETATTIIESVPEQILAEEKIPEEKLEEGVVDEFPVESEPKIAEIVPESTEEIKDQQQDEEIVEETTTIIEETPPDVQETVTEELVIEKAIEEVKVEDIPLPPMQREEIQEFPDVKQTYCEQEIIEEKVKSPEESSLVEETITTSTEAHHPEIVDESRSQKMLVDISDICIDNTDNLSGLTTLAAVSELTGSLYDKPESICQPSPSLPTEPKEEEPDVINSESSSVPASTVSEEIETTEIVPVHQEEMVPVHQEEMVPVHQEEIVQEIPATAEQPEKPIRTLANFSMDFSDSNSESAVIKPVEEDTVLDKMPELIETQEIPVQETQQTEICEPMQTVESTSIVTTEIPNDFESIESEIEKITSIETHSDKLNSFPENISHPTDTIDSATITYPDFTLSEASTTITTTISNEFVTDPIEEQVVHTEATLESEIAKLTDTHPDTENVVQEQQQNTSSSKLLEILTDSKNLLKKAENLKAESPNPVPTRTVISAGSSQKVHMVITGDSKSISKKFDPKTSKFVIKSATSKAHGKSNKPIILSEKIIKPVTETENVSVKKVTSKRTYQDVEDIDTFIIQKPSKKANTGETMDQQDIILTPKTDTLKFKGGIRGRGKPKIIEQTIIKAADVVQPVSVQVSMGESQQLLDDSMFDINSMPIVLSDQILTPESIENMPVVMTDLMPSPTAGVSTVQTVITEKPQQTIAVKRGGTLQQVKLLNKSKISSSPQVVESAAGKMNQNVVVKNIIPRGLGKNQKVYQTGGTKLKNNPAVITTPGKPGRFIILPSSTTTTSGGSKYTVGKRLSTVKSVSSVSSSPTTSKMKGLPSSTVEPTGNKIMIVTNQQGVQSRVLLTPAQQKMLGCKMPTTKIAKSPSQHMKGGVMQKSILTSKGTILAPVNSSGLMSSQKSSSLASQTIVTSKGQLFTTGGQTLVTSEGQVLTPITQQQLKTLKSEQHKVGKKLQIQSSRVLLPDKGESSQKGKMMQAGAKTKTILIKGTQGQTLKKIQSPMNETKNIALSQSSHKTSPLISISSSQMSGKQVMLTSKGQLIKQDMKVGMTKQYGDKLQRVQSPKVGLGPSHRIVTKSPRTQMLVSPASKQHLAPSAAVPPLAPITATQSKKDAHAQQLIKQNEQKLAAALIENKEIELADKAAAAALEQKQPNQLIIQDTLGNQTTVTEGQILALPSETIDGQPQSYVLVTVDETGNLVPISNDTLMSLDPSLAAGGDMSNIVLQIDQGAQETQPAEMKTLPPTSAELPVVDNQQFAVMNQQQPAVEVTEQQQQQQMITMDNQQLILPEQNILTTTAGTEQQMIVSGNQQVFMDKEQETFVTNTEETQVITTDPSTMLQDNQTAVACSINSGDTSQQLIITGDPESTQKFLASLSEGNTDLSSLLSSTDGNIIINTDGQQILLNPDSDNQILLSVNSDNLGLIQTNPEGDAAQNAMYVTQQAMKNQDILAAALADTDVFQQESAADKSTSQALTKVSSVSQLSPSSNLYPMNVGNVLETSLTLGSPIMTPLEVPSVNNKKIASDVESTLISRVRSSLELPITITDPSIAQTVSQQVMLSNDLQTNLELPITMSDTGITSITSSEMSSPSFVYSLPTLDENTDLEQKRVFTETSSPVITTDNIYSTTLTGSMSMPLLTEEPEIATVEPDQTSISADETPTVTAACETVTSEIIGAEHDVHQSTNYPVVSVGDSLQPSMSEKISSDMQMGAIEEELDLNATDICSSLSEPPPGMFDNIVNPRYLSNKEQEEESPANIPLPGETTPSIDETANVMNDNDTIMNEPISSLPMLSDGTENETGNSDMMTNSSSVTEKSPIESNLDMDYGVSESSDQHSLSETVVNQDVPRSEMSETPNSDLNSPRLDIDETSGEIPIQPPIVTNLDDNFENNTPTTTAEEFTLHPADDSRKRTSEDREEDDEDTKRTRLSCD